MNETRGTVKPNPYQKCSGISKMLFMWMNKLMAMGYKTPLTTDDLYNVTREDSSDRLCVHLQKKWEDEVRSKKKPSLFWVVVRTYGPRILLISILPIIELVARISLPLELAYLMRYTVNGETSISETRAYITACIISVTVLFQATIEHPYCFFLQKIGMRIRIALCSVIYKKSLRLDHSSLAKANTGHIVNLMSNDVTRFDTTIVNVPFIYIAPFEMLVIMYVVYSWIGISAVVGYAVMLVIVISQKIASKKFSVYRHAIAKFTDKRIHLMSEVLSGMRVIKLYCWEPYFQQVLTKIRSCESVTIFRSAMWKSIVICGTYFSMVKISLCACVLCYSLLLGNELSPRQVFVIIGMYNICKLDIGWMLPSAFQSFSEFSVSLRRIQEFLQLEEYKNNLSTPNFEYDSDENVEDELSKQCKFPTEKTPLVTSKKKISSVNKKSKTNKNLPHDFRKTTNFNEIIEENIALVQMNNCCSLWEQEEHKGKVPILENLNLQVNPGELIAVIGPVGSGKTSLLLALLGEIPTKGQVSIATNDIAYACQEPWVFSSSFKQNILFGKAMQRDRFNRIVQSVGLDKDLEKMPKHDSTLVGERGMSLSGGQRARLNLARAVYSNPELILMDDPLSAVDMKVGRQLFDQCIKGELRNKTRILVTHQLLYIQEVDRIVIMKNGRIEKIDNFENLKKAGIDFSKYLYEKTEKPKTQSFSYDGSVSLETSFLSSLNTLRSLESCISDKRDLPSDTGYNINDDVSETKVGAGLYKKYLFHGVGAGGFMFCMFLNVLLNGANVANDWMLANWSNYMSNETRPINTTISLYNLFDIHLDTASTWYLIGYIVNILGIVLLSILTAILLFYITISSSKKMHNAMLKSIFRAPISFFDNNPVGRILNRFSKDTGQLDEEMTNRIYELITCTFVVCCIICVTVANNPMIFVALIPLGLLVHYVKKYAISTSRHVKRLEAATRSPVFTHASASMFGLTTIRAFNMQRTFEKEFDYHQNVHTETWFIFLACTRWMALRLDILCAAFVTIVTFTCVFYAHKMSSAMIGLTLTYAFSMVDIFQFLIRLTIDVENLMTSVERIFAYIDITPEVDNHYEMSRNTDATGTITAMPMPCTTLSVTSVNGTTTPNATTIATTPASTSASSPCHIYQTLNSKGDLYPSATWPSRGIIQARDVSMSYAEDGPLAINHINFTIESHEKIGIVGRTGAGKSSLISMLFRLTEHSGYLSIDGVDVSTISLHKLRSNISIIPQDPVLFVGTLRDNLDPFKKFDDSFIWKTLSQVQLGLICSQSLLGLNMPVLEGGSNFSVGQRQLICLARALLERNQILVIDEATANVDLETDILIQKTIREQFKTCTVLTIAHRINTIMDSDRIMVMDKGSILQFEKPEILKQTRSGGFYEIAQKFLQQKK